MEIEIDDLSSGDVLKLLDEHLKDMYATSPAESVHALDVDALKAPEVTFFSAWENEQLLGCAAIKKLNATHVELKSMRTSSIARKSGVASNLLNHILEIVRSQSYERISLETGSGDYFIAARNLYEKFGFSYCEPFADYIEDPSSKFMSRALVRKP